MADISQVFKRKLESSEFARLIDELYVNAKIDIVLYENLDRYRKKRNDVIHDILRYEDKQKLNEELKEVYLLGRQMKGFIVEDLTKETRGLTAAELNAELKRLMQQLKELHGELAELDPNFAEKVKDILSS